MSAETLIEQYITDLNAFTSKYSSEATDLVQAAQTAMYYAFNPDLPESDVEIDPDPYDPPRSISLQTVSIDGKPELVARPDGDISTTLDTSGDYGSAPNLSGTNIDASEPRGDVRQFTAKPPSIDTSFEDVEIPSIGSYEPLQLIDVDTDIGSISYSVPEWTGVKPEFLGDTPSEATLISKLRTNYESELSAIQAAGDAKCSAFLAKHFPRHEQQIAEVESHLSGVMTGTATAWEEQTHERLYQVAKSQAENEAARVTEELERSLGARGAVVQEQTRMARARLQMDVVRSLAAGAYSVARDRAQIEFSHLQTALQINTQLRSMALQMWLAYNQQMLAEHQFALQFGESMVNMCIQAHNMAIQRYNADLDAYRTEAQVWETKLKVALVDFEIAKYKLEVARLQTDVNAALIAELEAQVKLDLAQIDAAVQKLRAIAIQLDIRKLPLEVFKAEIEAHQAYLDGRKTEVDIYRGLVDGQRSITQNDLDRVNIWRTKWQGWREKIAGLRDGIGAEVDRNRSLLDFYRADLDRYGADLDYAKVKAAVQTDSGRLQLDEYKTKLNAALQEYQVSMETEKERARIITEYDRMRTAFVTALVKEFGDKHRALAEVNTAGAKIIADLAAAGMAANGSNVALINETTQQQ